MGDDPDIHFLNQINESKERFNINTHQRSQKILFLYEKLKIQIQTILSDKSIIHST